MVGKLLAWPVRCCVWAARTVCGGCIEAARVVGKGMVRSMHRASDAALDVVEEGVTAARETRERVDGIRRPAAGHRK